MRTQGSPNTPFDALTVQVSFSSHGSFIFVSEFAAAQFVVNINSFGQMVLESLPNTASLT